MPISLQSGKTRIATVENKKQKGKACIVTLTKFTGDVEFVEGFQFGLSSSANSINMKADRNSGEPLSCESFYSHLHDCDSIISSINGVTTVNNPGIFQLYSGDNLVLYSDPVNYRIYIGLKFKKTDVCKSTIL